MFSMMNEAKYISLLSLLVMCLAFTCCTSTGAIGSKALDGDDEAVDIPDKIFGVIGYVTEVQYLKKTKTYFPKNWNGPSNYFPVKVKLDVVSNVIGYSKKNELIFVTFIGQEVQLDPTRGPIFVLAEEDETDLTGEYVFVHDWGRLNTMMCIQSKHLANSKFPGFRVDEWGEVSQDPNVIGGNNVSGNGYKVTMESIYDLEGMDQYTNAELDETCYSTNYGYSDKYKDLKKRTKSKMKTR